ncbi:MAG TPA: hypothetical protein VK102_01575 [Sphingobacterium sp.]|nr:hypothetical protein [Sphingobacterium sp.]
MEKKSTRGWWIIIPLILVLVYFIYDGFTQKGLKDVPGGFKEEAFVRNEQNKGGIIRIYAVSVADIQNAQYDEAADLFPVNDYASTTTVYFFDKNNGYPSELTLEPPHFDTTAYKAISIIKRTGTKK